MCIMISLLSAHAWIHIVHKNNLTITAMKNNPPHKLQLPPDTLKAEEINAITFNENSHAISHGQKYEGTAMKFTGCINNQVPKCYPHSTLTIKASRHQKSAVADQFSQWLNNIALSSISSNLPSKLNFAVKGILSYKGIHQCQPADKNPACKTKKTENQSVTIENFIFAQNEDHWWLGSPNCVFDYNELRKRHEHKWLKKILIKDWLDCKARMFTACKTTSFMTCKTKEGGSACVSLKKNTVNIVPGQCSF